MINDLLKITLSIVRGLEIVTVILIWIFIIATENFMDKMRAKGVISRREKTIVMAILDDSIMEFIRKYCVLSIVMISAELVHFIWFEGRWSEASNYFFYFIHVSRRLQLMSVAASAMLSLINDMIFV